MSTKPRSEPSAEWKLKPVFTARSVAVLGLALALLVGTGVDLEIDTLFSETGLAVADAVGVREGSKVLDGFGRLADQMFPPTVENRTPIERLPDFDRNQLAPFAYVEKQEFFDVEIDYETLEQEITVVVEETLVEPLGYLSYVLFKMLETLEIALWGTVLAVVLSVPLAFFCARNYAPGPVSYGLSRAIVSLFRSIPELVTALFFVLAYGFGPVAGVLALGFHCTGFLGKFYAEDIENAEKGPQEALAALGAGRLKVLRVAVIPQVLPQYIAYTLYILDRNIRMATVIGLVGAGGIGQELKGRWDLFNYSHVGTILIVLFLTVFALDQFSARIRQVLIR